MPQTHVTEEMHRLEAQYKKKLANLSSRHLYHVVSFVNLSCGLKKSVLSSCYFVQIRSYLSLCVFILHAAC